MRLMTALFRLPSGNPDSFASKVAGLSSAFLSFRVQQLGASGLPHHLLISEN
jgi:hypothetical protein